MTIIGAGGVVIQYIDFSPRFQRDFRRLPADLQQRVVAKLRDLEVSPHPPGLRFEKLQGYRNPAIYTVHVTGNYKISMEIIGNRATLRRVACHDEIDRNP